MNRDTKRGAVRGGLKEHKRRLRDKSDRVLETKAYLEREVWPHIPSDVRGKKITRREQEEILGIGPDGYCK
jgi:hypothetical protein